MKYKPQSRIELHEYNATAAEHALTQAMGLRCLRFLFVVQLNCYTPNRGGGRGRCGS